MNPVESRTWKVDPLECRSDPDGDGWTLSGYAVKWRSYSQNLGGFVEQFLPSAFATTLSRGSRVVATYNHNDDAALGSTDAEPPTLRMTADDVGLFYEIRMSPHDPDAQRVRAKVDHGTLRGSSFTFATDPGGVSWSETEQGYPLRSVSSARLMELGPVLNPAYLGTTEEGSRPALRSFCEQYGHDMETVVAAAGANELRSLQVVPPVPEPDVVPASKPDDSWKEQAAVLQRQLDALRRS